MKPKVPIVLYTTFLPEGIFKINSNTCNLYVFYKDEFIFVNTISSDGGNFVFVCKNESEAATEICYFMEGNTDDLELTVDDPMRSRRMLSLSAKKIDNKYTKKTVELMIKNISEEVRTEN